MMTTQTSKVRSFRDTGMELRQNKQENITLVKFHKSPEHKRVFNESKSNLIVENYEYSTRTISLPRNTRKQQRVESVYRTKNVVKFNNKLKTNKGQWDKLELKAKINTKRPKYIREEFESPKRREKLTGKNRFKVLEPIFSTNVTRIPIVHRVLHRKSPTENLCTLIMQHPYKNKRRSIQNE